MILDSGLLFFGPPCRTRRQYTRQHSDDKENF